MSSRHENLVLLTSSEYALIPVLMEARESYYMKNISKYKLIFKSGLFVVFMSLETFVSEKSL